ncbi:unnamed protein product [Didymodactylos carnosus]|uniref:Uncharacterized protein n=2 Tax=Didymodactylos carnosus TaxID=1234261 RepID=A0A8S2G6M9_9BILA|nr:unnamed protein product [Didymodactylos carnosus]CAF4478935.1 unnamed protein product [Didymodactylos carnosus]
MSRPQVSQHPHAQSRNAFSTTNKNNIANFNENSNVNQSISYSPRDQLTRNFTSSPTFSPCKVCNIKEKENINL